MSWARAAISLASMDGTTDTSGVDEDGAMGDRDTPLPQGTVTLLLTDLEGSTRLWLEAGEAAAATSIGRHYEILGAAVARYGGVRPVEQGEGDSIVAGFDRPADALVAAIDIQRAFAGEPWPSTSLCVRVGLHTGEIGVRGDDNYQGPSIIRCARLRNAAHGGQIVLSDATREALGDDVPPTVSLRDLGEHRLKGLQDTERVWQVCGPGLDATFPPLRSLSAWARTLPMPLSGLVGRQTELEEVGARLATDRLVTVTGAGGAGKSRLALQVASDAADRFEDGVWWVDLSSVRDERRVANVVLTTFGLVEEHDHPPLDTLVAQLRDRRSLIVLDNCEHLLDGVRAVADALLEGAPDLTMLTTTREPLGITAEAVWRIPSLSEAAAVELFVERARQSRSGFTARGDDLTTITQICRRLDGVPLAIELAAARVRMMSVGRIAEGLDDRFRLLSGGSRAALPRQQTLEGSVAWSHDLLADDERIVFRRLAAFAGGFGLDAAEHVAADGRAVEPAAVLDLLGRLVDRSLVQVEEDDDELRYRMLETIRQFARLRLVEAGEVETTMRRHLAHHLARAEEIGGDLIGVQGPQHLVALERDHDDLRAALDWADADGDHDLFLRLATALTLFWEMRGHVGEGMRWFALGLGHGDPEPSVVRARALWGAAHLAVYNDDFDGAFAHGEQALAMAELVGDTWARARALNAIGYSRVWFDAAEAERKARLSIELGRALDDDWLLADGLKVTTAAVMLAGDVARMLAVADELVTVADRIGSRFFLGWVHTARGLRHHQFTGQLVEGRAELALAGELCREVGDPATGGLVRSYGAWLEADAGHLGRARRDLEQFVLEAGASGAHLGLGPAVVLLTSIYVSQGEAEVARRYCAGLSAELNVPFLRAWTKAVDGAACMELGDLDAAAESLRDAAEIALGVDHPWPVALVDHEHGRLAAARGDLALAEDHHHRALQRRVAAGLTGGVIDSLEALGGLAARAESDLEALRLLAGAAAHRERTGLARWPVHQPSFDEAIARAEAALDEGAAARARAEGAALSLDELVAYVSRARGERKRPSSGWASLTPTEEEVVALVAEGLTNPQIGERLFIARSTVKAHLSHIFVKLGVTSRSELAASAVRRLVLIDGRAPDPRPGDGPPNG